MKDKQYRNHPGNLALRGFIVFFQTMSADRIEAQKFASGLQAEFMDTLYYLATGLGRLGLRYIYQTLGYWYREKGVRACVLMGKCLASWNFPNSTCSLVEQMLTMAGS